MADEQNERDDLLPGEGEEKDYLFQAQMAVFKALQAWWRHALVLIGIVLVGSLVYGLWDSHRSGVLKDGAQAIAEVTRRMPDGDPTDPAVRAQIEEGARRYEAAAADSTSGTAAEGWLRAGEVWQRLGETDKAEAAYTKALAAQPKGFLGYSARAGLAVIASDKGDDAKASKLWREQADASSDMLAQEALIALARLHDKAGDREALQAVYDEFRRRFNDSPRVTEFAQWDLDEGAPPAAAPVEGAPEAGEG